MTSVLHNPIFNAETRAFRLELRDDILRQLPLESLPPAICRDVRQRLEQALADLALAGQRDPGQLERYARAKVGPAHRNAWSARCLALGEFAPAGFCGRSGPERSRNWAAGVPAFYVR